MQAYATSAFGATTRLRAPTDVQPGGRLLRFWPVSLRPPWPAWRTMKRAALGPLLQPSLAPLEVDARQLRDQKMALWVAAAAAGDASAFEAFYEHSFAHARTLARRLLRGSDVEDLLADAYFEAWRTAARFDARRGSAMSWLLTIVRSRSLDLLRRHAVSAAAGEDAQTEAPADSSADPAASLWQHQLNAQLSAALAALSAAERWVLGLAYFREMSHAQIALTTGLPLGTVKTHLLRGQQRLRAQLAPSTALVATPATFGTRS
jgi:RNA polymerase sigma-70 factor, ECF subfamily